MEGNLVYSIGVSKWPCCIINECTTKVRNFIWSGSYNKRKIITIKWDKVNMPKNEGGLGLRLFPDINRALLMKMAWSFVQREDKLEKF